MAVDPRPPHQAGKTVYLHLKTYNPATKKVHHRWHLTLRKWTVEEVREIVLEAFKARQLKGGDDARTISTKKESQRSQAGPLRTHRT